jgi:uncharacterized peroxidase-related enzyme
MAGRPLLCGKSEKYCCGRREVFAGTTSRHLAPNLVAKLASQSPNSSVVQLIERISFMPHIELPPSLPGISAAFAFRPETAAPMRDLAHVLLFEAGRTTTLSSRDRELIAAYVSSLNNCYFCHQSHAAAAAHHTGGSNALVSSVCENPRAADISPKLRALLAISARIQSAPKGVTPELVEAARAQGATDIEIHDTVLIAAAFCMYNRYVDGLATWQPRDTSMYSQMGEHLASKGYRTPSIQPDNKK